MPVEIKLSALSPDMETAILAEWHKQEGDSVSEGDVLADIETDKATIELEATTSGILGKIVVAEGSEDVAVGTVIGVILQAGESIESLSADGAGSVPANPDSEASVDTEPQWRSSNNADFEVVVVGGGPGGYVAAIRAAQLGMKTALVEREHLGGICLNWGCIPTKALLRSAEVYHQMSHAEIFGLSAEGVSFDLAKMVARSREVSGQLNDGIGHLLKKNGVVVYEAQARLLGDGKLSLEKADGTLASLCANHIILATGARPRELPGLETDGKLIWSYKQAMTPDRLPKSLLVMGAGAIGIEFASFYNTLGVDVTIVEVQPQILPMEDPEIAEIARKSFSKQGIRIITECKVTELRKGQDEVTAVLAHNNETTEMTVDRVISAVGVVGNHENLGLESTRVAIERTHVVVNEWLETAELGVYAIGDLAGPPCLAHKASHEGVVCVERIAGLEDVHPLETNAIPGCTYSRPQVASIGYRESEARERGFEVRVGRFPYLANGKAIAMGETEGMIKTVFDARTGELLGAHMVGAEVTEMIQGFGIAQVLETTEQDLIKTVFPHPTLSEMMHESVLDAFDKAIHI